VYLARIAGALAEVARRRRFRLLLIGAGDDLHLPGVQVERRPWILEREFTDFAELDIGLYPLPDTPWARGKCGFKAIQYLASGVPAVCSPVGVTMEIVEHGGTGLWARTDGEWVAALERLLDDAENRRAMGVRGREIVREKWSHHVYAPHFVAAVGRAVAAAKADGGRKAASDKEDPTDPALHSPPSALAPSEGVSR
jgi:glycosyltransferase involved in cell wall biosynthesis